MYYFGLAIVLIIILLYFNRETHTIAESTQDRAHIVKTTGRQFTYDEPTHIGEMDLDNKHYGSNFVESDSLNSDTFGDDTLQLENMRSIPVEQDMNEKILQRSISGGKRFKQSTDGRARTTRNLYEKFFKNDLDHFEEQEWWGGETRKTETDWRRTF